VATTALILIVVRPVRDLTPSLLVLRMTWYVEKGQGLVQLPVSLIFKLILHIDSNICSPVLLLLGNCADICDPELPYN
jgi:hypothetical protein